MADYKHPEVLVTTQWAADHANDPKVRLVEVDVENPKGELLPWHRAPGTAPRDNVRNPG